MQLLTDTLDIKPGSIVRCRNRQWVVLPSENLDVVRLRSLSGNEDEITGIFRQLLSMNLEAILFQSRALRSHPLHFPGHLQIKLKTMPQRSF